MHFLRVSGTKRTSPSEGVQPGSNRGNGGAETCQTCDLHVHAPAGPLRMSALLGAHSVGELGDLEPTFECPGQELPAVVS